MIIQMKQKVIKTKTNVTQIRKKRYQFFRGSKLKCLRTFKHLAMRLMAKYFMNNTEPPAKRRFKKKKKILCKFCGIVLKPMQETQSMQIQMATFQGGSPMKQVMNDKHTHKRYQNQTKTIQNRNHVKRNQMYLDN